MTLVEFFDALSTASVQVRVVAGQVELQGAAGAVTGAIRAAAAEHKPTMLALLQQADQQPTEDEADPGRQAIEHVEAHPALPIDLASLAEGFAHLADQDGFRHDHDWRDWRLEWQLEVGGLYLRMRDCRDEQTIIRLKSLADAKPMSASEWLTLGRSIRDTEEELRKEGKLPPFSWPER